MCSNVFKNCSLAIERRHCHRRLDRPRSDLSDGTSPIQTPAHLRQAATGDALRKRKVATASPADLRHAPAALQAKRHYLFCATRGSSALVQKALGSAFSAPPPSDPKVSPAAP